MVGDRDVTSSAPEEVARAGVGYVPQVDDVFAPLTVRENLEMGGYLLRRAQVAERIERGAGRLPPARRHAAAAAPGKLSGGERKMLAMGRVLMLEPGRVPARRADRQPRPIDRQRAARPSTSASWPTSGAAVLIVEQRAKAVLAISDRTYVLGGGEVRMAGTPAELSASPDFVESFLGAGRTIR